MRKSLDESPLSLLPTEITGQVRLITDSEHLKTVVLGGMLKASHSVDIATADFKAMLVPDPGVKLSRRQDPPSIVQRLVRLAERGVEVRVMHAGVPSAYALKDLKKACGKKGLPPNLTLRRCPRLHAKAVIVDAQRMYLGSANLTGAGLGAKADQNRNHEIGVWTESGDLIDAVSQYFNRLWEGGHCEGCGRRDVCPVPLEEPRL